MSVVNTSVTGNTSPHVVIGGSEYPLVPLTFRQINEIVFDKRENEANKDMVERRLRGVAYSLLNGGSFEGKKADEVMDIIDTKTPWMDVGTAFVAILEVSGLKKDAPGEAPAAGSITDESAAE
jgi:hypothetical protein